MLLIQPPLSRHQRPVLSDQTGFLGFLGSWSVPEPQAVAGLCGMVGTQAHGPGLSFSLPTFVLRTQELWVFGSPLLLSALDLAFHDHGLLCFSIVHLWC